MRSHVIEGDLLSIQNGIDSHEAGVGVNTKSTNRILVGTRPCYIVLELSNLILIRVQLKSKYTNTMNPSGKLK